MKRCSSRLDFSLVNAILHQHIFFCIQNILHNRWSQVKQGNNPGTSTIVNKNSKNNVCGAYLYMLLSLRIYIPHNG